MLSSAVDSKLVFLQFALRNIHLATDRIINLGRTNEGWWIFWGILKDNTAANVFIASKVFCKIIFQRMKDALGISTLGINFRFRWSGSKLDDFKAFWNFGKDYRFDYKVALAYRAQFFLIRTSRPVNNIFILVRASLYNHLLKQAKLNK